MARPDASELTRRLARRAEAVCRLYLSNGRRQGRYWQVGDARNTPGRSMFVRLFDDARGPAGKWCDAATGEHGDLLDVIREALGLTRFADVVEEARRFLGGARGEPAYSPPRQSAARSRARSTEAARRLFSMSQPITGTLAETYLHARGLTNLSGTESLRFHSRCWWRPDIGQTEAHPALIAAVTDLDGWITGVHRTWLAADGSDKAAIDPPRKAMGELLGNAVHFGVVDDVLAAGEGIETVLSLRQALLFLPAVAALSAAHLAAVRLPATCRRLYVLRDRDPAGEGACHRLVDRAKALGIEAVTLVPRLGDFNEDLCSYGAGGLGDWIRTQLVGGDAERFRARVA
ncbi:MAG: toprim domain-containing protein [Siculibacillus sp.]|nr:toprim domain-containing protein [Siculibacillus sp.]